MRKLALVLALFVSWGCRSAAPKPPSSPQPPDRSAEYQPRLPFLELPLGLEDTTGWESAETEGILVRPNLANGLAEGEPIPIWLVSHGICDPSGPHCLFAIHVQVLRKPGDGEGKNQTLIRYAFRGAATGISAEGCMLMKTADGEATYHSWARRSDFWVYQEDEQARVVEFLFVVRLSRAIDQLADAGQLKIF